MLSFNVPILYLPLPSPILLNPYFQILPLSHYTICVLLSISVEIHVLSCFLASPGAQKTHIFRFTHLKIQTYYPPMREHAAFVFLGLSYLIWNQYLQLYPFTCKFQLNFFFTNKYNSILYTYHIFIIHYQLTHI